MQNSWRRRIEWGDTDAAGIVFYPNYYRWFDTATHELFRACGWPVDTMLGDGFAIPIVEALARFMRPLVYDDVVDIRSRISYVRSRSFRVDHEVVRSDETVCVGHELRAWVKLGANGALEPREIPEPLLHLMGAEAPQHHP